MTLNPQRPGGIRGSERWRAGGTQLDITGLDADTSWLAAAVERATEGYIVPLTVNGVEVAWITPPEPMPLPPMMRKMVHERLGMRPAAQRIAERQPRGEDNGG
ncbi:MAG TPA: hypothetical protein VEV45_20640 [Streptosporangiaceae bacterium]|nr:hypothetical protein [Streptosporangiaceae bacterium]